MKIMSKNDVVIELLNRVLKRNPNWRGTMTQLLDNLFNVTKSVKYQNMLPGSASSLRLTLNKIIDTIPNLYKLRVRNITFSLEGHNRVRIVTFKSR